MSAAYPLCDLFPKALPSPIHLQDGSDGASLLVLACHCCMIRDGYILRVNTSTSNRSGYSLPADWNSSDCYWALRYTHDAYEHDFILEGHRNGAQLLIRVLEETGETPKAGNVLNVQQIGLNSERYVPDLGLLNSQTWQGVLSDTAVQRLSDLWSEYMAHPLMQSAKPRRRTSPAMHARKPMASIGCPYSYMGSSTAIAAMTVAVGAALAGALFAYRSQLLSVGGIGRHAAS